MRQTQKRSETFRLLFGTAAVLLLAVSVFTNYRFGSAPTDENWFVTPPDGIYTLSAAGHGDSSVPPFVFLQSMDGVQVKSRDLFEKLLKSLTDGQDVSIVFLSPASGRERTVLVPAAGLHDLRTLDVPPSVLVASVIQDGASDRAGMRAGDLIVKINGHTFRTVTQADSILRSGQIGKELAYDVIRDGREITLSVRLANFGFPFSNLAASITGLIIMVVGGFLGLKRPGITGARFLGSWFLAFGFLISTVTTQRGLDGASATVVSFLAGVCAVSFLPLYLHTHMWFPEEKFHPVVRKILSPLLYALAGTILFSLFMSWGTLAQVIALLSLLAVLAGRFLLRRSGSVDACRLTKPLDLALLAAIGLAVIFWVIEPHSPVSRGVNAGFVSLPLLLIPVSYLYVIGRYRLLDLNLRIRRSLQYSIVATAWVGAILMVTVWLIASIAEWNPILPNVRLTGGSIEVTDDAMTPEERDRAENTGILLLGIAGSVVLWKIGRYGLRTIAGKFHRGQYDYKRAANELTEVMSTRVGMQNLARGIVEKISEIMHLKNAGVLFFDDEQSCCCDEWSGFDGSEWRELCIRTEDRLIDAIKQFTGEFRIDYLPDSLKSEFRTQDIQYIVPIRSKERLVGAILVGEKLSESGFLREDLEFLSSVSKQASVAIENAFLYTELAEKERIKHELGIARRIQMESLPQETPRIDGLDISGVSVPATEVGGDYFDYLNGEKNRLTVIVGDVSGKGTSAALYMAKIQGIIRSLNVFGLPPGELLTRTNRLLWNDLEKRSFVTALGISFDTASKTALLARAGHLPLFLFRHRTGTVERVLPRGIGLGLSGNGAFDKELQEQSLHYEPGDVFVLVTDGITEGKDLDLEEFGEERLEAVLCETASAPAATIRERIIKAVEAFSSGAPQHDDQTVVVVKAVGSPISSGQA